MWLRLLLALLPITGCSYLLGSGSGDDAPEEPDPPDDCPVAENPRVTVFEGQGATSFGGYTWAARARFIHVSGTTLPGDEPIVLTTDADSPLDVVDGTFNGSVGVLEVVFPIDDQRPPIGAESETVSTSVFAFSEDEKRCIRVDLDAVFLAELGNGATLGSALPRYSFIDTEALVSSGTTAIELRSESAIVFSGTLSISANAQKSGPGGGEGGAEQQAGKEAPSGGSGSSSGSGGVDGGGGGHAEIGSPGSDGGAPGGLASGHVTLLRMDAGDPRGGHGGGGGATSLGGGGGGALFARARSAIVVGQTGTTIEARGAPSSSPTISEKPGGGSGGAVFLAAPMVVRSSDAPLRVDVGGGEDAFTTRGASGRLRIDSQNALDVLTQSEADTSVWLGAGIRQPQIDIRRSSVVNLEIYGGRSASGPVDLGWVQVRSRAATGLETMVLVPRQASFSNFDVELAPGLNEICIDTFRHVSGTDMGSLAIADDALLQANCVELAYIP